VHLNISTELAVDCVTRLQILPSTSAWSASVMKMLLLTEFPAGKECGTLVPDPIEQ